MGWWKFLRIGLLSATLVLVTVGSLSIPQAGPPTFELYLANYTDVTWHVVGMRNERTGRAENVLPRPLAPRTIAVIQLSRADFETENGYLAITSRDPAPAPSNIFVGPLVVSPASNHFAVEVTRDANGVNVYRYRPLQPGELQPRSPLLARACVPRGSPSTRSSG